MFSLYVDNGYSFSCFGYNTARDRALTLRDFHARVEALGVWRLENGALAAFTQERLDEYMESLEWAF